MLAEMLMLLCVTASFGNGEGIKTYPCAIANNIGLFMLAAFFILNKTAIASGIYLSIFSKVIKVTHYLTIIFYQHLKLHCLFKD